MLDRKAKDGYKMVLTTDRTLAPDYNGRQIQLSQYMQRMFFGTVPAEYYPNRRNR